jgi:hypothetical protein
LLLEALGTAREAKRIIAMSSKWNAALVRLRGSDPLINHMLNHNIPLTRENYISGAYGAEPDEWTAEHEAELPLPLQKGWEPEE